MSEKDDGLRVKIIFSNETGYTWIPKDADAAEEILEELATKETVTLHYSDSNRIACVVKTNNMAYACKVWV
jgi:hypothetical protein